MLITVGVLVTLADGARADDKALAQSLFDRGMELLAQDDINGACAAFEASLRAFAGTGTRGKLAECYEKQGRLASAWAQYREVEAVARRASDEARATIARERAAALEPRLGKLLIDVSKEARVPGLVVRRSDGDATQPIDPGAYGVPLPVDAGTYALRAEAPGRIVWASRVSVRDGEATPVTVPPLAVALPRVVREPQPPIVRGSHVPLVAPIAVIGGGVALVASIGLGALARDAWHEAHADGHCDERQRCDPTGRSLAERARSRAIAADATAITGGIAIAVGVAVWWRARRSHESRTHPIVAPGVVGLSGTF